MKIQTKTSKFININELKLEEDFKEFLMDCENGFTTEILYCGDPQWTELHRDDIDSFVGYEKSACIISDDLEEISHMADLQILLKLMQEKEIDYITIY